MKKITLITILLILAVAAVIFYSSQTSQTSISAEEKFITEIKGTPSNDRREIFERYYNKLGPKKILDILESNYSACHAQAHDLGRVVLTTTNNFRESVELCGSGCTSGCYHGMMMEAFKDITLIKDQIPEHEHGAAENDDHLHADLDDMIDEMDNVCGNRQAGATYCMVSRVHIAGQAIESLYSYDIQTGLNLCELINRKPLQLYCASGIFKEHDLVYGQEDLINQTPHYPCDIYTEFPSTCYRYKMPRLYDAHASIDTFAQECLQLEGLNRLGCFHGFGFTLVDSVEKDPKKLATICSFGNLDDQRMCIEAIVEELVDRKNPLAHESCDSLEGTLNEVCIQAADRGYFSLDKDFSLYFEGKIDKHDMFDEHSLIR